MNADLPARVVVDASVAAAWVLPEPSSDSAMRLLTSADVDYLCAPELWLAEVANAVWKQTRRSPTLLSHADAAAAIAAIFGAPVQPIPHVPIVQRALDIALVAGITAYDALYAACAEREGAILITLDRQLLARLQRWDADFPVMQLADSPS